MLRREKKKGHILCKHFLSLTPPYDHEGRFSIKNATVFLKCVTQHTKFSPTQNRESVKQYISR